MFVRVCVVRVRIHVRVCVRVCYEGVCCEGVCEGMFYARFKYVRVRMVHLYTWKVARVCGMC